MTRSKNANVLVFILRDLYFVVDDLGNYIDYAGMKDNLITEDDDLVIAQEKVYTQEHWLISNRISDMNMGDWYIQYLNTSSPTTARRF